MHARLRKPVAETSRRPILLNLERIPWLPEEEPPAYFRRALAMCTAKNFLMACRSGSGSRSCRGLRGGDTFTQQAGKWTLRGILCSWTPEMIEKRLEHEKFTDRCRAASKSGKSEGEILENFPFPALAKTVRSKGHRYWTPVLTTFQPALCPIQRPNRWLDGLIAHALATTLQTYILVFERHQGACGRPRAGRPRRASGAHYVWVANYVYV